jgi:hypothetical protein
MAIVRNIIKDALTEIGFLRPGETPSPEHAQLALLRFQNQIDAWMADRLTLAVQLQTTFTLTSGTSSVTLGTSGADVTMIRPVFLNAVNYIIPGSSPAVEVPIGIMDQDAFSSLTIKELPSALPLQCFYQNSTTTLLGTLFFWPQVTQNVEIVLYTPQAIGIPASLDSLVVGPPGYAEAFMYQLALRCCTPFGVEVPALLPELSTRAFANMKRPNVYPGILGVDAALVQTFGAGYNVYSDTTASRG